LVKRKRDNEVSVNKNASHRKEHAEVVTVSETPFSPRKKLRPSHGTDADELGLAITSWCDEDRDNLRISYPRFFDKIDALESSERLTSPFPRVHYAFWLLNLVEEIFDARYEFEMGLKRGVGKRKKVLLNEILREKQKEKAEKDPSNFQVMKGRGNFIHSMQYK
jgi:hypothetical protein